MLLIASAAFAQDAATVALDPKADLAAALKSPDALTRATAGRVALVRGDAALVPALREALAAEKDATAAREEMRAIVLLGSDDDIAFTASQLPRFPASIDGDFGEAIGRLGAPRATTLYLEHVVKSRDPVPAMKLALWGRPALATATASRLLGAGDARGWNALLSETARSEVAIDPAVLATALSSKSNEIVKHTIRHLVEVYGDDPARLPDALREAITVNGLQPQLTRREEAAPDDSKSKLPDAPTGSLPSTQVKRAAFSLPIVLPEGLAEAILTKTRCRDLWIGLAKASVDEAGRVQALDVSNVGTERGCTQALETMLRLSLAEPEQITSLRENVPLLVVKPQGRSVCFDEDPVRDAVWPRGARLSGIGDVKAPVAVKRVEPMFPANARHEMGSNSVIVMAEALVTKTGCVRDVRLVKQTQWPSLNSAAVLALSGWTFKPGTLNGVPVDVIFFVTISFRNH